MKKNKMDWFGRCVLIRRIGNNRIAELCGVSKFTVGAWFKQPGSKGASEPKPFDQAQLDMIDEGINPKTRRPL